MIIVIVSAIESPISSVVSEWLGGSRIWWKWPWNLVPTLVGMPDSSVSLSAVRHAKDGVFGHYPFFIVREWFAKQWQNLGLQFGARPSSARGRARFWGGDGGVYGKKAAVAYYCGNLSFTDFLLTLIRIYYFFIIYFIFLLPY